MIINTYFRPVNEVSKNIIHLCNKNNKYLKLIINVDINYTYNKKYL